MGEYFLVSAVISVILAICIIATATNTSRTNDYLKAILEELRKRPM
jgi:hypothetical protein